MRSGTSPRAGRKTQSPAAANSPATISTSDCWPVGPKAPGLAFRERPSRSPPERRRSRHRETVFSPVSLARTASGSGSTTTRRPVSSFRPRNTSTSSTARTARPVAESVGEEVVVLGEVPGRRPHRVVLDVVDLGREIELPALRPSGDGGLGLVVEVDPGRGKDPAVVGAARPGPVLVDRAGALDQHRAVPVLVVAEEDVAPWQPGRREQQGGGDVSEGVGLVGPDVDELRGSAAGRAPVARHVRVAPAGKGALHPGQPGGEVARRQRRARSRVSRPSVLHPGPGYDRQHSDEGGLAPMGDLRPEWRSGS